MKLKSLILGSVAAAGLSTTGFAADLGVLTSLDVCDELGLAGLTISSDTNCLQISGEVTYDYTFTNNGDEEVTTDSELGAYVSFVATSPSDLGPASATFTLEYDEDDVDEADDVRVAEAFVSIGDTTILTVGLVDDGSLISDQGSFESFGGFFDEDGAEFDAPTGGHAIQLQTLIADGISVGAALENLEGDITAVGFVQFTGAGGVSGYIDAFVNGLVDAAEDDDIDSYGVKATIIAELDMFEILLDGGVEVFDEDEYDYDVALGILTDVGAFHLAGYAAAEGDEVDENQDYTVGAEIGYDITEAVAVFVAARYDTEGYEDAPDEGYQIEAGMVVALSETLSANASIGYDSKVADDEGIYAGVGLDWSPNADFEANINLDIAQTGAYEVSFGASKSFE